MHANHPLWMHAEARALAVFNKRLNAFFSHGEAGILLARRDGESWTDHRPGQPAFNDYQKKNWAGTAS